MDDSQNKDKNVEIISVSAGTTASIGTLVVAGGVSSSAVGISSGLTTLGTPITVVTCGLLSPMIAGLGVTGLIGLGTYKLIKNNLEKPKRKNLLGL